jgi:hypothetical protein
MSGKASDMPVWTDQDFRGNGVPVVTDGPYAETQEVLAGYWIIEFESFDRPTGMRRIRFATSRS